MRLIRIARGWRVWEQAHFSPQALWTSSSGLGTVASQEGLWHLRWSGRLGERPY
jgi:hypothetical protein